MTRLDILRARLLALAVCFLLLLDLLGDLLLSVLLLVWAVATKQEGSPPSPFETMSARAARAGLNRKLWARITMPVIDRAFGLFQGPVAQLPDGRTFTHPSHCLRAFIKLRHGAYLPREYTGPLSPSIEACYARADSQPTGGGMPPPI